MKNSLLLLSLSAVALTGCGVSQRDFFAVQSQVSRLENRIGSLQGELARSNQELAQARGELAVVKKQRVVRLPTGAPTIIRERNNADAGNVSEDALFNAALRQYKAGDVSGAITSFQRFIQRYPNSPKRAQAQFYQGQAAYTQRDYRGAQSALEPLVFQPADNKVNWPAARLLRAVYAAQNNAMGNQRLTAYLTALKSGASVEAAVAAAKEAGTPAKPADKPMRPSLVQ